MLAEAHGTAGGASSLHIHRGKANTFIMVEGALEVWSRDGLIASLCEGDTVCVPAGEPHRMVWRSSGVVLELYHALPNMRIDLADIERMEPGWKPGERTVVSRTRTEPPPMMNPMPAFPPSL